jgi:ABC-type Fe3+/spermidine/putrescine transport system ATPase subunit
VPRDERESRVAETLKLVGLSQFAQRFPRKMSGGQQQRVALARALVTEPRVLLLDEPLSNLDALLRDEMRVELKRLQERLGTTMIFVTHDQAEALILSDRVVVMQGGRVEQVGPPEEVYRRPATPFVARFLGRANFFAGTVTGAEAGGVVVALDGGLSVVAASRPGLPAGQRVQVAIRQENIRLDATGAVSDRANRFSVTVVFHAFAGQAHHYVVQLADGRELEVTAPGAAVPLARGAAATIEWGAEDVVLLAGGEPRQ